MSATKRKKISVTGSDSSQTKAGKQKLSAASGKSGRKVLAHPPSATSSAKEKASPRLQTVILAKSKSSRPIWISIALLAVIALVTFEVMYLMKSKVERQRQIRQIGTFGIRGEQNLPQAFKGTFLEKIDRHDRLYHIDEFWKKVIVFDAESGNFILTIDQQTVQKENFQPQDVDADSRGTIYVLDYANREIVVLSREGQFLKRWPAPNAETLAVDLEDNLLVTDLIQKEIVRYSPEGKELQRFGRKQSRQKIEKPWRLVVDKTGRIYLLDQVRKSVLVYGPKGNFLYNWSLKFNCNNNTGMAERDGKFYLNDFEGHLIWVFSTAGKILWQVKRTYPGTIAVDSQNQLYLAVYDGIGRFVLEE